MTPVPQKAFGPAVGTRPKICTRIFRVKAPDLSCTAPSCVGRRQEAESYVCSFKTIKNVGKPAGLQSEGPAGGFGNALN